MKLIRVAVTALAVFTFILSVAFFIWWAFKDKFVFNGEKFDQVKWIQLAADTKNECKRGDMAYDLQQNILARGVQREAVTALLGRPAFEDENSVEYDLGKCMHVYHGLLIFFDQNNRLISSRISSH